MNQERSKSRKKKSLTPEEKKRRYENQRHNVWKQYEKTEPVQMPTCPVGPSKNDIKPREDGLFHLHDPDVQKYVLSVKLTDCMYTITRNVSDDMSVPTTFTQQTTDDEIAGKCTVHQMHMYIQTIVELMNALTSETIKPGDFVWVPKFWQNLKDTLTPTKREPAKENDQEQKDENQVLKSYEGYLINAHQQMRDLTVNVWKENWTYMYNRFNSLVKTFCKIAALENFNSIEQMEQHFNELMQLAFNLNWFLGQQSHIIRAMLLILELSFLFIIHIPERGTGTDDDTIETTEGEKCNNNVTTDQDDQCSHEGSVIKRYALNQLQRMLISPNQTYVVQMVNRVNKLQYGPPITFASNKQIDQSTLEMLEREMITVMMGAFDKHLKLTPPLAAIFRTRAYKGGASGTIQTMYENFIDPQNSQQREFINKKTKFENLDFCYIMSATHKSHVFRFRIFLINVLRSIQRGIGSGDKPTIDGFIEKFNGLFDEILFPHFLTDDETKKDINPNMFSTFTIQNMRSLIDVIMLLMRVINRTFSKSPEFATFNTLIDQLLLRMNFFDANGSSDKNDIF